MYVSRLQQSWQLPSWPGCLIVISLPSTLHSSYIHILLPGPYEELSFQVSSFIIIHFILSTHLCPSFHFLTVCSFFSTISDSFPLPIDPSCTTNLTLQHYFTPTTPIIPLAHSNNSNFTTKLMYLCFRSNYRRLLILVGFALETPLLLGDPALALEIIHDQFIIIFKPSNTVLPISVWMM